MFLISDFLDSGFEHTLNVAAKRHDLVPIVVTDPTELELPNIGLAHLRDPETGVMRVVDTASARTREHYRRHALRQASERDRAFRRLKMDVVNVQNGDDYIEPLATFFKRRACRF